MRQLARINDQQLLATIATFSPDLRNNDAKRAFELAGSIVEYFFGQEWIDKHVSSTCPTNEYLRVVPGEGQATETSTFKIVDFAELLYNLQNVAGLHICIDRLKRGVIEPTYAELDLGRMLYSGDVDFRFIIFLKVPHWWFEQPIQGVSLNNIAETFLHGTGRVVSVKFYFSHIVYRDKSLTHSHTFKEISNPNNRFDPARDWNMFAEPNAKSGWNGMPPRWKRLLFFPNDGPT
jgi:hypothetical protein